MQTVTIYSDRLKEKLKDLGVHIRKPSIGLDYIAVRDRNFSFLRPDELLDMCRHFPVSLNIVGEEDFLNTVRDSIILGL